MTKDLTGIDPLALAREGSGRTTFADSNQKQKKVKPPRYGTGTKKVTTPAPAEASAVGQVWYDLGVAHGFDLPFDVNWFSHRLQERVDTDRRFQRLVKDGREDDGWRLVRKMSEVWWRDYVTSEVSRKNAADFFLRVDWTDCQEYSLSSLRAAYLRDNGKVIEPTEFAKDELLEHRQRLRRIDDDQRFGEYYRDVDLDRTPPELDPTRRDRLRSFVEGHRQKRGTK